MEALTQGGEVHCLFEMTELDLIGHSDALSIRIVLLNWFFHAYEDIVLQCPSVVNMCNLAAIRHLAGPGLFNEFFVGQAPF
jgi:hypothetical protein